MLQDENTSNFSKNAESELLPSSFSNARRICKSCRRRVGLCFLCHEPVKGVYVWCPGCGTFVVEIRIGMGIPFHVILTFILFLKYDYHEQDMVDI